jgi:hypothetical protein
MKWLLHDEKLTFIFRSYYVSCYNYGFDNYQANGILSFAITDFAFKIIKQQKRNSIVLKKRKPIIHLLNYIDTLNFNLNSSKFDITFFLANNHKTRLTYNLYLHRRKPFKDFAYKASLKVIEREDLCTIRFEDDFASRVQPKNVNFTAMVMHIFNEKEIDTINVSGIIFYCLLLI